jgi:hypothetical protein
MKNKTVIAAIGTWFKARQNNQESMDKIDDISSDMFQLRQDWFDKFTERIKFTLENRFFNSMPFTDGVTFDFDGSEENKLVFRVSCRHDTNYESYEEWDEELGEEIEVYPKQFCGYSYWRIEAFPSFALDFDVNITLEDNDVDLETEEFEKDITEQSVCEYLLSVFGEEFDHNDPNNYPEDERERMLELRQTIEAIEEVPTIEASKGMMFRMGGIGDPGSIAPDVYLKHDAMARKEGLGILSYTHQWQMFHISAILAFVFSFFRG